jgi:hypothetical protein
MESALAEPHAISLTEDLLRAGARILQDLTKSEGGIERSTAIDLLAADALITYAVEAAAEECESFAARSDVIMTTVANVPIS